MMLCPASLCKSDSVTALNLCCYNQLATFSIQTMGFDSQSETSTSADEVDPPLTGFIGYVLIIAVGLYLCFVFTCG